MKTHLLITIVLFFVIPGFSQDNSTLQRYKLKGVVKTQNSEVIAITNLYFKKDGITRVVPTDVNGKFKTELSAGDYEITISDVISKSFKAFVKIQDEKINPRYIEFVIKTNSNPCGLEENETCPKPLKLPKPAYPAAARATGTKGEAVVLLTINKEGKVVSAEAQNTHPLLRTAVEKAGMNSLFEPSEDDKIREFKITYVFSSYSKDENDKLKRYDNLFRIDVFIAYETIQY